MRGGKRQPRATVIGCQAQKLANCVHSPPQVAPHKPTKRKAHRYGCPSRPDPSHAVHTRTHAHAHWLLSFLGRLPTCTGTLPAARDYQATDLTMLNCTTTPSKFSGTQEQSLLPTAGAVPAPEPGLAWQQESNCSLMVWHWSDFLPSCHLLFGPVRTGSDFTSGLLTCPDVSARAMLLNVCASQKRHCMSSSSFIHIGFFFCPPPGSSPFFLSTRWEWEVGGFFPGTSCQLQASHAM